MIKNIFVLMKENQNLVAPKWALSMLEYFRSMADSRGLYTFEDRKQGKVCALGNNIPEVCFITDFATRRAFVETEIMLYPIKTYGSKTHFELPSQSLDFCV